MDGLLIALVFGMALFGIVAVCVATYSPQSAVNASFLNHVFESDYTKKQCLFVLMAPLVVGVIMAFPYDILLRRAELFYWASFIRPVLKRGLIHYGGIPYSPLNLPSWP